MSHIRVGAICCGVLAAACVSAPLFAGPDGPAARWEKEPASYRGIAWGAAPEEAQDHIAGGEHGGRCLCGNLSNPELCDFASPDPPPARRVCFGEVKVGGVTIKEQWTFLRDRFAGTALSFGSGDYERLRDMFVERYGPSTKREEEPFQTRGGAKSTNETLTWKGADITIQLTRYAGTITEGSGRVWTKALMETVATEAEERKREGAKVF